MKKTATPFFYVLLWITTGCSQKVINYVNPSSAFKTYESYVLVNYKVNQSDLSPEGEQIFSQISSNINLQMARRDYLKEHKNPDLVVRFELISNQVTEVDLNHTGFYSPFPRSYFTSRTFLESALLVEITDHATKKLVWQASVDLDTYAKKKDTPVILQTAIEQIFNTYLYRSGSDSPDESLIVKK